MQQQQLVSVPGGQQQQQIYLKTFLMDYSITQNGIRVKQGYLENQIHKFVGKDVILTKDKNHPPEFRTYKQTGIASIDIPNMLRLQNKHRIGRIVEVNRSPLAQGSNELVYTAIIELDTDKGKNLYKHGLLPKFVSPSIYKGINNSMDNITDFEPLHLALVSSPAFGNRALLRASCENSKFVCMDRLAQSTSMNNNNEKLIDLDIVAINIKRAQIRRLKEILDLPFQITHY